ncbi:MAG: hypothetical protein P8M66_02575 [Flavobacteriaceae bacterium]|nr:hypothetical protein [Flavobacteriaceae bacterium]MDB4107994.1 hypothetical protein [Flavobacteriaceae bacterium]MDG2498380.1 hypothetical protein [Flavobacteriaceae bacterium]
MTDPLHHNQQSTMYHYIENPPLVDSLSIRNIYNRKNLISREYRGNNSLDDPIELIEKLSIGITPNLMFRIYW